MNATDRTDIVDILVPPYAMNKAYRIPAELNRTGIEADGHLLYLVDPKIDVHDKVRIEDLGGSFIRQECTMENGKVSKSLALFIPNTMVDGKKISYKIGRYGRDIKKPFSASERS